MTSIVAAVIRHPFLSWRCLPCRLTELVGSRPYIQPSSPFQINCQCVAAVAERVHFVVSVRHDICRRLRPEAHRRRQRPERTDDRPTCTTFPVSLCDVARSPLHAGDWGYRLNPLHARRYFSCVHECIMTELFSSPSILPLFSGFRSIWGFYTMLNLLVFNASCTLLCLQFILK